MTEPIKPDQQQYATIPLAGDHASAQGPIKKFNDDGTVTINTGRDLVTGEPVPQIRSSRL